MNQFIHKHIHTHTHTDTHTHTHIHTYIHTQTHTRVRVCTHTHTHTHTQQQQQHKHARRHKKHTKNCQEKKATEKGKDVSVVFRLHQIRKQRQTNRRTNRDHHMNRNLLTFYVSRERSTGTDKCDPDIFFYTCWS